MSTGSRENKQGSTEEKTNTGNKEEGEGPQSAGLSAFTAQLLAFDTTSTSSTSTSTTPTTSVKHTAQETSPTRQTPALLSKRSFHTYSQKHLPSPRPALTSGEVGSKPPPLPFWPQSSWQRAARYCWRHWERLLVALCLRDLGELDRTGSEGSPDTVLHKLGTTK